MEFKLSLAPATRNYLLKYAQHRLQDIDQAEDIVQGTLLTACRTGHTFAGRSSEKTWLIGVLKHKISDYLRRVKRERVVFERESDYLSQDERFDEVGNWQIEPTEWNDPWRALASKEFQVVLIQALNTLPVRQAEVFWLREVEGLSTEEICKVLSISTTNTMVLLYRARLRLREYLEVNGFNQKPN
jgi:RNA polymerase sigma-70 factor (ECF subfamily)